MRGRHGRDWVKVKELTLNRRETRYLFRLKERGQGGCDMIWGRAESGVGGLSDSGDRVLC